VGDALTIRPATRADAAAIAAIYAHFVGSSVITFEIDPPDRDEIARRMDLILPRYPYLVAEMDGELAGYAYAGQLYERAAYRWTVEATVYVAPEHHRQGVGRRLYSALLAALDMQGFQSVIGKITLPNLASVALHEAMGFVRCGLLAAVGYKHGGWHDVGIYQLDFGSRPDSPAEPALFNPDLDQPR
jgi:L-amino acid N-acyltransferase YncA